MRHYVEHYKTKKEAKDAICCQLNYCAWDALQEAYEMAEENNLNQLMVDIDEVQQMIREIQRLDCK